MSQVTATATYSVEDNKLRLYFDDRLDNETYQRVTQMGFKWAPKQELFVAPMWTPEREDFCLEFVEEIEAEGTSLLERAEMKANRLDTLSTKRANEAQSFFDAAQRISKRFEFGQPILVGHHSERRARKDKERMESEMSKAVKAHNAINYWRTRAEGVERHACRKADPGVRSRRIKTLLKELRDYQRRINHANKCLILWSHIFNEDDPENKRKQAIYYSGALGFAPDYRGKSLYSQLEDGDISVNDAITICIDFHEYQAQNPRTFRCIHHILNRLEYERGELGEVVRYEGELTPVILQAFAREQGADKPVAQQSAKGFRLESPVALPFHLGEGSALDLSLDSWRDLMQSVGHQVNTTKRKAPKRQTVPLLNPTRVDAEKLQQLWNVAVRKHRHGEISELREMTQAQYSAHSRGDYTPFETITLDQHGQKIWSTHRATEKNQVPVCRVRVAHGGKLYSADRVIILTDKPGKPIPLDLDALVQQAKSVEGEPVA